jgi:hypothetical protein
MALSKEDHKDVKNAMGRALANKVKKATQDFRKLVPTHKSPNGTTTFEPRDKFGGSPR